ncbi:hypothetical protein PENTCL1PPCAC_18191 [Pristionchus entomophagus]|uniref:Uncharacterized protein n=1 Tax=Pristionchus entomophagus TaxID=358040 RepID=A0AAV5TNW3_9BILA|nr:hypothetical protein PENTCL1PPCAC_18191 [Pristionchus entomophagus]
MTKPQRKSRKKMNKLDGTALRDPTANAYKEMPATHNRDPSTNDQETPKAVREMLKRIEEGKQKGGGVKRSFPKKKDKVKSSLASVGIQKKSRESIKVAIGRMHDKINTEMEQAMLQAKAGVAGKDTKQIAKEYKEMDEAARAKREVKLLKRKKEEEEKFGHARDKTMKRLKMIEEERMKDGSKAGRKKMNRMNREKEKRKEEKVVMEKETMLDAKEVIDFGERYDAPPVFKGKLKCRIDPLSAKAGGKSTLLLHSMLGEKRKREEGDLVVDIPSSESSKKDKKEPMTALMMAERQRVIDAYRKGKRDKNGGVVGLRALKDTIDL